jgi:AcrR family transcriptional regulator
MATTTPEKPEKKKKKPDSVYAPKQKRSEKTHAAIIAAARELVMEEGAKSLTITDVAARAGLTTGALYARFRNKEAMIEALYHDIVETDKQLWNELLAELDKRQAGPVETVKEAIRMTLKSIRAHGALFRLLSMEIMESAELRQLALDTLEEAIRLTHEDLLRRRKDFLHPDPALAAIMLTAILQGATDWILLFNESPSSLVNISDEVLIEELTRATLGYLGPASTEEEPSQPKGSSGKS